VKHSSAFESILGLKDDIFFSNYFEKEAYYSNQNFVREKIIEHFSERDLEELLLSRNLTTFQVRLSSTQSQLPVEAYSANGYIVPEKIFHFFHKGYTVIIRDVENLNRRLSELLHEFDTRGLTFRNRFINLYFTPANSQGFHTHYDNQEVIITQIFGTKKWSTFYPSLECPVDNLDLDIHNTKKPSIEKVLRAGDSLYIPRGIYHHAETVDQSSCHLTFSLIPYTYMDAYLQAVKSKAKQEAWLRKSWRDNHSDFKEMTIDIKDISHLNRQVKNQPSFEHFFKTANEKINENSFFCLSEFNMKIEEKDGLIFVCDSIGRYTFPAESKSIFDSIKKHKNGLSFQKIESEYDRESTSLILKRLLDINYIKLANN